MYKPNLKHYCYLLHPAKRFLVHLAYELLDQAILIV